MKNQDHMVYDKKTNKTPVNSHNPSALHYWIKKNGLFNQPNFQLRTYIKTVLALCFLISSILTTSSAATADNSINVKKLSIEELLQVKVNVASHFEEDKLDTASTVEQITMENWKERGARTVADAVGNLPSTALLPSINGGYTFAVRGYTSSAYRGVNMQLDGVPLNDFRTGGGVPQELLPYQLGILNKIEMIRGAGSVMYGADAFHGVLSLQSFSSEKDVTEIDTRLGTDLYRETAMRLSRTVTDKLRLNTAFSYNGNEDLNQKYNYTDPDTGTINSADRQNRFNSYTGIIKLESDPKDDISGKAGVYFYGHNAHDFSGQGRNTSPIDQSLLRDRDLSGGNSRAVMGMTSWSLKLSKDASIDVNGYGWRKNFSRKSDFTRSTGTYNINDVIEDRAGGGIFLKEYLDSINTRVAFGYEFNYQQTSESTASMLDPDGELISSRFVGSNGRIRRVHSPVLDARTDLFDDHLVSLVYGGRFDDYSDSDDHFSPRAGIIYRPTSEWAVKFLYGNAYRAIASSEEAGTAIKAASGQPEIMDTYEFTLMKDDQNLQSYATFFFNKWKDAVLVVENPTPPPALARINSGENRSHGIETGLTYNMNPLKFDLNGSYVRSRDETDNRDYVAFPTWILNAGVGSKIPYYDLHVYLNNRFYFDQDAGPILSNISNPESLNNYWKTDLTFIWSPPAKPYKVYLSFLNLFDRKNFFPSAFSAEGGTPDIDFTAQAGIEFCL